MTTQQKKRVNVVAIIGAAISTATALQADEFGSNTRYDEDDAWYDGSERFDGKQFTGTVEKTKTAKIQGQEHQFAKINSKINTKNGKTMMVDLEPTITYERSLENGVRITVQGVPVKVNDRVVLVARQIMHDGDKMEFNRQVAQSEVRPSSG